jgi:hypothetical protein
LVVLKILPEIVAAYPVFASVNETHLKFSEVTEELVWLQLTPALVVFIMSPLSPTEIPLLASVNEIELRFVLIAVEYFRLHVSPALVVINTELYFPQAYPVEGLVKAIWLTEYGAFTETPASQFVPPLVVL